MGLGRPPTQTDRVSDDHNDIITTYMYVQAHNVQFTCSYNYYKCYNY